MLKPTHLADTVYLALLAASVLLTGCSSMGQPGTGGERFGLDEPLATPQMGSLGKPDPARNLTRSSTTLESGAGLIGKTLLVDPLIRPFSTIKALYGATIKSTGGFIDRTLIEQVRFPRLERRPIPDVTNGNPMDLAAWERQLDDMTGKAASRGTIRFLVDGETYFDRLRQVLIEAEESIDMRTYIFDNDDVALEIADLLRDKSSKVDIRILVDGLADLFATRRDSSSMPVDVELPPSISSYLTDASRIQFRKQSNPWFTGDHVKITIVDEDLAFLGGMNIGREYRYDWHDLMMEVEGPVVTQLRHEFDLAWAKSGMFGDLAWFATAFEGYPQPDSTPGYPLRVLSTTIHDSEIYRVQVAAIRRARNHIYIENAYFSDDKILFELARARRRGVDVRVILAEEGDSGILNLSNRKTINTMLRNGIRVYIYPGMTHLKAAIYDGWACLGSANFDKLSLQINREINLGTSHRATVNSLMEQVFYPDFAVSTELYEPVQLGARHHIAEVIADEIF